MKKIFNLIFVFLVAVSGIAQEHSGGIVVPTGFKIAANAPVDDRFVVADSLSLYDLPNKYDGMFAVTLDEEKRVIWTYNEGEGLWYRAGATDAENTSFDDTTTQLGETNVQGAIVNIAQNGLFVNVKSFGAVGDGVVDDTEAIQTAIDYARDNNKRVFIPNGTYKVSYTNDPYDRDFWGGNTYAFIAPAIIVYDGTYLVGEDKNNTIIIVDEDSVIEAVSNTQNPAATRVSSYLLTSWKSWGESIFIKNITFDGNKQSADLIFEMELIAADGYFHIDNCIFKNAYQEAIDGDQGGIEVINCEFYNITESAMNVNQDNLRQTKYLIAKNNIIDGCGISFRGGHCVIAENTFQNLTNRAISLNNANTVYSGGESSRSVFIYNNTFKGDEPITSVIHTGRSPIPVYQHIYGNKFLQEYTEAIIQLTAIVSSENIYVNFYDNIVKHKTNLLYIATPRDLSNTFFNIYNNSFLEGFEIPEFYNDLGGLVIKGNVNDVVNSYTALPETTDLRTLAVSINGYFADKKGELQLPIIDRLVFSQRTNTQENGDFEDNLLNPDNGIALLLDNDIQDGNILQGVINITIDNQNKGTEKVIELFGVEIYNNMNPSTSIEAEISFTLEFFNQVDNDIDFKLSWKYLASGEILFNEYTGIIDNQNPIPFELKFTGDSLDKITVRDAKLERVSYYEGAVISAKTPHIWSDELKKSIFTNVSNQNKLPSVDKLKIIDSFIDKLKRDSIWSKLDTFVLFALNDSQVADFSLYDYKRDMFYTSYGGMIYTINGFEGNGVDGYIDTNFAPSSEGTNYSLNDASRTTWVYKEPSVNGSAMGTIDVASDTAGSGSNNRMVIGSSGQQRINQGNANVSPNVNTIGVGLRSINRDDDTNLRIYVGDIEHERTANSTSINSSNQILFTSQDGYGDFGLSFYCMGASLSKLDIEKIIQHFNDYKQEIGL